MAFPHTPDAVVAFARGLNLKEALLAQSGQMLRPLEVVAGMPLVDGSAIAAVRCEALADHLCGVLAEDIVYVAVRLYPGERRARAAGCTDDGHSLVLGHDGGNVRSIPNGVVMQNTLYDARALIEQPVFWKWPPSAQDVWRQAIEQADRRALRTSNAMAA